jgi:3-oxoacyl-[acyl-carrier protein] reductase
VINARNAAELAKTAKEISTAKGEVQAVAADVTKPDDASRLVDEAVKRCGTIHVLVNNAGGLDKFAAFADIADQEWTDVFNWNFLSAVRVTRAVLPHMQKQKWGRIINISSESGVQPDALMPHYNASKAALNNLTKSLSKAYGQEGILVNTVSPAFIRTPLVDDFLGNIAREKKITVPEAVQEFLREYRPNIVLRRAGEADETAGIVVFLASQQASFITGSNFRVDGGSVASV